MSGKILEIYMAPESEGPMRPVAQVQVIADKGLVGDRYFGADPDETIALVEVEQIDKFNLEHGTDFHNGDFRRGVITEGVDLNTLVGKTFMVGDVRVYGAELCEPCSYLASITTQAVLPGLVHKAGLRGRVLDSGTLSIGDAIRVEVEVEQSHLS